MYSYMCGSVSLVFVFLRSHVSLCRLLYCFSYYCHHPVDTRVVLLFLDPKVKNNSEEDKPCFLVKLFI